MSPISITNQKETKDGWEFSVETPSGTTHAVTLTQDYYEELTGVAMSPEKLVWISFSFLLDRESSAEIMDEFNISDIETYFPDFPDVVKRRIQE